VGRPAIFSAMVVPEAKQVVGHGQMDSDELEKAMLAFVRF